MVIHTTIKQITGRGVVDGDNYADDDDNDKKGSGLTTTMTTDNAINDDGGYSGRDGHHRMRKGRQHDNGTKHNNKKDHH